MAFVEPTPATFIVDFPAFEDKDPADIQRFINVAKRMVDQTWTEGDYTRAIELYAAHVMTIDAEAAASGGMSGGNIASESLGPISVSYAQPEKSAADVLGLDVTSYGREFRLLQRLNRGGARII